MTLSVVGFCRGFAAPLFLYFTLQLASYVYKYIDEQMVWRTTRGVAVGGGGRVFALTGKRDVIRGTSGRVFQ